MSEASISTNSKRIAFGRLRLSALAGALVGLLGASLATDAVAQAIDCGRLQAQLASLPRGDASGVAKYVQAAQKQRAELDRTSSYARSIGCERRQFLFFGSAPPPQCGPIGAQMQRMQANLDQINGQIQRMGGGADATRRDLTARYNAYCRTSQPRNFFEQLFGGNEPDDAEEAVAPPVDPLDSSPRGGPKAVCVRTCDGAFFPISYSATRRNLGNLADLCSALCPNSETEVFTYSMSRDIDDAVSVSGKSYKSMPYADKFRTKFDSSCACKAQGQSWVEALAEAERILGKSKNDVIVTPEKSAELSKVRPGRPDPKAAVAKPHDGDDPSAEEAALAAKAPTASDASSGISPGTINPAQTFGRKDGEERQIPGRDGVTKRVRVIGPTL